jgi:hypothetical protein
MNHRGRFCEAQLLALALTGFPKLLRNGIIVLLKAMPRCAVIVMQ